MSTWQGSAHGYGSISEEDVVFLEGILKTAATEFGNRLKVLEVGIANAYTGRGMDRYCKRIGCQMQYSGIDGECGTPHPGILPEGGIFYKGDSREIFESIPSGYNVLFIDACHCNNCCMLDFLNYSPKVVIDGYVVFHDTNPSPLWQGWHDGHWQGHGPKTEAFCIATQMALGKLGLLANRRTDWRLVGEQKAGHGLGMTAYKKVE